MSTKKISVQVRKFNHVTFTAACKKEICCEFVLIKQVWSTPIINASGTVTGYEEITAGADATGKPGTDSVKIAKVNSCGDIVEVVLADTESVASLKTACNVCCGDPEVVFSATIPAVRSEVTPCVDDAGARKISIPYRDGAALVVAATFNGVNATPLPLANYATGAAFVTWATTNWSAYGTWADDATNKVVTLTCAVGTTSAGITIS